MTHGQILIRGDDPHTLYATHDGYAGPAVADLAEMPFLLGDHSKRWADLLLARPEDGDRDVDHRFRGGPYFAYLFIDMQTERRTFTWEPARRYDSVGDVYAAFRCGNLLELGCSTLAHWMVACRFGVWHVVWDKSQISYARKPDVVVEIRGPGDDETGYVVSHPPPKRCEFWSDTEKAFERIEARQRDFPKDCRVTVDRAKNRVHVPFRDVVVYATWQLVKDLKRKE